MSRDSQEQAFLSGSIPAQTTGLRGETFALIMLYVGLGIASAFVWTRIADLRSFPTWHAEMINATAPAPNQYRPLTPWIAELIRLLLRTSYIPLPYFIVRAAFTALSLFFFDRYLRTWFRPGAAAAGALALAAILPFTYFKVIQESDTFNLLIFILALRAIALERDRLLIPLILIGTVNRETTLMIPAIYFLARWKTEPLGRLIVRSLLLVGCWIIVYGSIRMAYGARPYYCEVFTLRRNLRTWFPTLHLVVLYGALWVIAFVGAKRGPTMLRRALRLLPPYIVLHYFVAIVTEVRLFLPFAPIVIPLAWFAIFPTELLHPPGVGARNLQIAQNGVGAKKPAF